jgi:hypothetical protein
MLKGNGFKKILFCLMAAALLATLGLAVFAESGPIGEFNSAVDDIKNAPTLTEKERRLEEADAKWAAYLASVGGEAEASAAAAYADYTALKEQIQQAVASSNAFIEFVIEAEGAWQAADYDTAKAAILEAEELLEAIDMTYEGASSSRSTYDALVKEIEDCEKPYRLFVQAMENALAAENYKAMKQAMNEISTREKEIAALFVKLPTYEGYAEAVASKATVSERMADIMADAAIFITAVQSIDSDNIKEGIISALEIYEQVDSTADGVSAAKGQLDKLVRDYEGAAEESGEAIDDMSRIIFGCLLW